MQNRKLTAMLVLALASFGKLAPAADDAKPIRVGIIGVDTSHAIAFSKMFNDPKDPSHVAGCRVIAAYPHGSADIPSSVTRIEPNSEALRKMGIEIVPSIDDLLTKVDAILLETNDGRPRLEQARKVIAAKKIMFIDKPVAASLKDTATILQEAQAAGVPVFSSSSLRYVEGTQKIRNGSLGKVYGCDTYSPASRDQHHPSLYWYGIHGVESLFTIMGPGCESVTRVESELGDVVVGRWKDGRVGTFRGLQAVGQEPVKTGFGGTAFGSKGIQDIGTFKGYQPLAVEINKFFQSGKQPIELRETLEIYAFMDAADESHRQGGKPVTIADTLKGAGVDPNLFQNDERK